MKKCPNCGAQNADDSRFCTECGKEFPQGNVCPQCGASVNEGDNFCQSCGKNLKVPMNEDVVSYEEEEEPKKGLKKYLPYIIGALLLLLIIGYFSSNGFKGDKDSLTNDVDSVVADAMVSEDIPPLSIDNLNSILSKLVGETDANKELANANKYFTESYKTQFNRACEKADKEGGEHPRLWWQYSGSDPENFTVEELNMTSENDARAKVKLSSEMYIGQFDVIIKNVKGDWLIDKITEISTENNPSFETSDNYEENEDDNMTSSSQSLTFANEQYVTMHLANKTFKNNTGIDIRIDGSLRMYIDGDYAGVVSVQRYSSTSALIRYGGGAYGEGYMMVNVENGKLKISDTTDGTTWYQR